MKIRTVPVIVSLLVTALLLFGGYAVYARYFIERPIIEAASALADVKVEDVRVTKDKLALDVRLDERARLLEAYRRLSEIAAEKAAHREVEIRFANVETGDLRSLWEKEYFAIAEAMDLRKYSQIPAIVAGWKQKYALKAAESRMDEKHVYIYLEDGQGRFFAVLPRAAKRGGESVG
ncbi:hypothetical protein BSNK01_14000 [Bacillaceae bacterium]